MGDLAEEVPVNERIKKCESSLEIEMRLKLGAEKMVLMYSDRVPINGKTELKEHQQLTSARAEVSSTRQNIRLLTKRLESLRLEASDGLIGEDAELLDHIKEIRYKLDAATKVYEGASRIIKMASKSNRSKVIKEMTEAKARMDLMELTWMKYITTYPLLAEHVNEGAAFDPGNYLTISGQLNITINSAEGLPQGTNPQVGVVIDNNERERTKNKMKDGVWNETFDVSLTKAKQIEFLLYADKGLLVGMAFFKLEGLLSESEMSLELQIEPV
eukprot:Ihof_evm1s609 gene=Ihof_evmTU1s609